MKCFIYRSKAKAEMYLYLKEKDKFTILPENLIKIFGQPEFSMVIDLEKRQKLARVNVEKVKTELNSQGYFLQMPPVVHSLLMPFSEK